MGRTSGRPLYFSQAVREHELAVAAELDLSPRELMQRAAQACFDWLQPRIKRGSHWLFVLGPGNNGGDGWLLARLCQQAGVKVSVFAVAPQTELAQQAAAAFHDHGGRSKALSELTEADLQTVEWIIDGLFGIGLNRPLSHEFAALVEQLNQSRQSDSAKRVLAIDCPSGLDSDNGFPLGVALRADVTLTFIVTKAGLVTGAAGDYCGQLVELDLGVGAAFRKHVPTPIASISTEQVHANLPPRRWGSHKGDHGHVLLIGGAPGYSGALWLAGVAALRAGAGKVTLACHPQSQQSLAQTQPELMVRGVATEDDLRPLLAQATVVAIGPGLGQDDWAKQQLEQALQFPHAVVIDADGLICLAQIPLAEYSCAAAKLMLTPHPGEAARLLGQERPPQNRYDSAQALAERYQAEVLLKGAGSIVYHYGQQSWQVCERGSPALASAGSGDVLTGIVAALLAQGLADEALSSAVWLHAVAAEQAALDGERGTLASDLWQPLRRLVNPNFNQQQSELE
ncbi:NAD(P)H-hydrate dehydratase [Pseudidiomarina taiwanensis]|uniref:Bifunctional NAD(P)H-hydrate repair enzyme n=1 Tax=Pseudidiomarina taiwanensis TaxID=337250 RepID=A0A432ZLB0_9GAMM|nr:NAD(P)H-hydrate dehydratase [Pseudidiomarina taiwanensis]RUO78620.1 bifunctional ADP-dependent NAD(P)H-hydrate dehydratase/NAD(P)H-hydrate epimerase [Pseudidiomarina taiwanensis]